MDSVFDADWKEEVGDNVKGYSSLSEEVTDSLLDKEIEKGEITKCLRNLKNSKTGGMTDPLQKKWNFLQTFRQDIYRKFENLHFLT